MAAPSSRPSRTTLPSSLCVWPALAPYNPDQAPSRPRPLFTRLTTGHHTTHLLAGQGPLADRQQRQQPAAAGAARLGQGAPATAHQLLRPLDAHQRLLRLRARGQMMCVHFVCMCACMLFCMHVPGVHVGTLKSQTSCFWAARADWPQGGKVGKLLVHREANGSSWPIPLRGLNSCPPKEREQKGGERGAGDVGRPGSGRAPTPACMRSLHDNVYAFMAS